MQISVPTKSGALVPFRAEVQRRLYPHVKNADESNGNRLEQVLQVCLSVCLMEDESVESLVLMMSQLLIVVQIFPCQNPPDL